MMVLINFYLQQIQLRTSAVGKYSAVISMPQSKRWLIYILYIAIEAITPEFPRE